jgi:hypothetical protein
MFVFFLGIMRMDCCNRRKKQVVRRAEKGYFDRAKLMKQRNGEKRRSFFRRMETVDESTETLETVQTDNSMLKDYAVGLAAATTVGEADMGYVRAHVGVS